VLVGALVGQPLHGTIVPGAERRVGGQLLQALAFHELQEADGVVPRPVPEPFVDGLEEGAGFAVPAPGEVLREMRQTDDPSRERRRGLDERNERRVSE